jgi:hypothetical protein
MIAIPMATAVIGVTIHVFGLFYGPPQYLYVHVFMAIIDAFVISALFGVKNGVFF